MKQIIKNPGNHTNLVNACAEFYRSILILTIFVGALSCDRDKDLKVSAPDFKVLPLETEYTTGDAVKFNFTGNADLIVFYSGEKGNLQMSFSTQCRYGSQQNQLSIWASTRYSGEFTEASLNTDDWTNITNRFIFATNTTLLSSGEQMINDVLDSNNPLYLAFRYVGLAANPATQKNWWFKNFELKFIRPNTSTTVLTQAEAEWTFVNFANNAASAQWDYTTDDRIVFTGQNVTAYSEGWAITKAIDPGEFKITGIPIKAYIDPPLENYEYVYNEQGTYNVKFEAINATGKGMERTVHEMIIRIKSKE
jgi:hypothetical protein